MIGESQVFDLRGQIALEKPFAAHIKGLAAELADVSQDGRDDRWSVAGRLRLRLEYVGTDGRLYRKETATDFRREFLTPGDERDSRLWFSVRIASLQYNLPFASGREWGREVRYQIVLALEAETVNPLWALPDGVPHPLQEGSLDPGLETASEPSPVDESGWQTSTRLLRVEEVIGGNATAFLTEQRLFLDLPAVKIIDIHGAVTGLHTEVVEGSVILQGAVFQQVYFVGDDGLIHYQHSDAYFAETVAVPDAAPGMNVQALARVGHIEHDPLDASQLLERLYLHVEVKVTRTVEIEVLTDLVAPEEVRVTRDLLEVEEVVGRNEVRHLEESQVRLHVPAERVTRVVATVGQTAVQVVAGKVIIEGVLQKQIFFSGRDGIEYHQAEEVPLNAFVTVPGAAAGMRAQVFPVVEDINYELDPTRHYLMQKVVLSLAVLVTEVTALRVVTSVAGPDLQVEEKDLTVERLIAQNAAQVMVVKKVPLVSRAIRVVDILGAVQDLMTEVIPDQMIIQGRLHQQIFFIDRHKIQRHQTEEATFNQLIELPGARPGMSAQVQPFIKHISTVLNPEANALTEKIVLDLQVKVVETVPLTVVTGVCQAGWSRVGDAAETAGGSDPVPPPLPEVTLTVNGRIVPDRRPCLAAAELTADVLNPRGEARQGRVAISGALRLRLYYTGPYDAVYGQEETVPFHQWIVLPGAAPGKSLDVRVRVADLRWEALPSRRRGQVDAIRWEAALESECRLTAEALLTEEG